MDPILSLSLIRLSCGSAIGATHGLREFSPPYAHHRAAGSKSSASAASLDLEPGGRRLHRMCVELRGATRVAPEVRLLPLHDLKVGATVVFAACLHHASSSNQIF